MNITKLTIEGRSELIGIDIKNPSFAWIVESKDSKYQTAYQYQLSLDDTFCEIYFDSGKIQSCEQAHILYDGKELEAKTRYYLRVKIWDENSIESNYSEITYFETGMLGESFIGEWIEPEQEQAYEEPECMHIGQVFMPREVVPIEERLRPCQYIRKEFKVEKTIQKARLYATSHGIYELYLNGKKVSDQYFAPELTSYQDRLLYQTYDVTSNLKEGNNTWGIILADGWHIGRIGLSGDSCQYNNKLAFLGQLEITYTDQTRVIISTDETFHSHIGKHVYADLFMGEFHDMRLQLKDFSVSNYDQTAWKHVKIVNHSKENLIGQKKPPIKIVEELSPKKLFLTPKGEVMLDFGKVFAGFVTMKASGERGTKIQLEFCEQLDENGNFWNHIAGRNNDQLDGMILMGEGEEIFNPSFTYHGFRYVKVSGYPGQIELDAFIARILGTQLEQTLEFTTSDDKINQLQTNIFNSQRGNMISLPTDCPQREKSGFTGDIQVYGVTGCYNMDLEFFLKDWLADVRAEQCENGEVPNIAPNYPKMKSLQQRTNGCQSAAGWGDACVILPWILYQLYDNEEVLHENYEMMKKWVQYIVKESPDYIWRNDMHFGDWLTPSLTKYGMNIDESLKELRYIVATCYFARSVNLLSSILKILGNEKEAKEYEELEKKIKKAFVQNFVKENRLSIEYQGMYVLALEMEMVEPNLALTFAARLDEMVKENGYCLDTGFMSVRYLLPILMKYGYIDTVRNLLFQTNCPSWLYQVEQGATSIWEKWDAIMPDGKVNAVSFNHYSFGCVGEFLYQYVAGLRPTKPGFKEFEIAPNVDMGFEQLNIKYKSIYGDIQISWKKSAEKYIIQVMVPFNTKAYFKLKGEVQILVSGQYIFKI